MSGNGLNPDNNFSLTGLYEGDPNGLPVVNTFTWTNPWTSMTTKLPTNLAYGPGSYGISKTLKTQLAQDQYTNLTMNSQPLLYVPPNQANIPITVSGASNLPIANSAPIPSAAESLVGSSGDSPLLLVKPSTGEVWEFWQAKYSGGAWTASSAAYAKAAKQPGAFPNGYHLSASGMPYTGTIVTLADVLRGSIDHAVSFEIAWATYQPSDTSYWPPGTAYDSGDAGGNYAPAEGMLLTWAPGTTKPTGLTKIASLLFDAIQNYGAYVMDVTTASDVNPNQGLAFVFEDTSDWAAQGGTGTDPITTAMDGQATYEAIAPLGNIFDKLVVLTPPSFGTNPTPDSPVVATGTVTSNSVDLSWSAITGAQYYVIDYSTDQTNWTPAISWPTGTSTTVTALAASTKYYFRVWAMGTNTSNASGHLSLPSSTVSATTSAAVTSGSINQVGNSVSVSPSNTIAVTLPSVTSGKRMLLAVGGGTGTTTTTVSSVTGGGATWTKIAASEYNSNNTNTELWTGTGYPTSGTPITVTVTLTTSQYAVAQLFEATNASALDGSGVPTNAYNTTATATSGTLAGANELVFAIGYSSNTMSTPSLNNASASGQFVWQWTTAPSTAPVTASWDVGGGGGVWCEVLAAFTT